MAIFHQQSTDILITSRNTYLKLHKILVKTLAVIKYYNTHTHTHNSDKERRDRSCRN
jgi:hypothetical protein